MPAAVRVSATMSAVAPGAVATQPHFCWPGAVAPGRSLTHSNPLALATAGPKSLRSRQVDAAASELPGTMGGGSGSASQAPSALPSPPQGCASRLPTVDCSRREGDGGSQLVGGAGS